MKLSISNIAWDQADNEFVYGLMKGLGFTGLEIAPTKVMGEKPYERLDEAAEWASCHRTRYGFEVSSMQSVLYGVGLNVFDASQSGCLLEYLKGAVRFASAVGCGNIVFGCPANRKVPSSVSSAEARSIAVDFFRDLGEYASEKDVVIALEPVNEIYGTNFLNTTAETVDFIEYVASEGLKLNLDVGSMIQSGEGLSVLSGHEKLINHVHISEPGLEAVKERDFHKELIFLLEESGYEGYVSVEMKKPKDIREVERVIKYIAGVAKRD